ncbi:MAG: hypothetical protein AAF721_02060 [Myxococcota bacterium]
MVGLSRLVGLTFVSVLLGCFVDEVPDGGSDPAAGTTTDAPSTSDDGTVAGTTGEPAPGTSGPDGTGTTAAVQDTTGSGITGDAPSTTTGESGDTTGSASSGDVEPAWVQDCALAGFEFPEGLPSTTDPWSATYSDAEALAFIGLAIDQEPAETPLGPDTAPAPSCQFKDGCTWGWDFRTNTLGATPGPVSLYIFAGDAMDMTSVVASCDAVFE